MRATRPSVLVFSTAEFVWIQELGVQVLEGVCCACLVMPVLGPSLNWIFFNQFQFYLFLSHLEIFNCYSHLSGSGFNSTVKILFHYQLLSIFKPWFALLRHMWFGLHGLLPLNFKPAKCLAWSIWRISSEDFQLIETSNSWMLSEVLNSSSTRLVCM